MRERTFVALLHFHFMTLHSTDARVNFSGKSTRFHSNVEPIETARLFPLPIGSETVGVVCDVTMESALAVERSNC